MFLSFIAPLLRPTIVTRPFASNVLNTVRLHPQLHSNLHSGREGLSGASQWGFVADYTQKTIEPPPQSAEQIWQDNDRQALTNLAQNPPATAYSGRSVRVVKGNVAEAYKRLENILMRNRVKYELRLAERHEKKGVKRRRLSSERWRKQFANEVRTKVQLVNEIRHRSRAR